MIGLYQEPGWETVTALFLPETDIPGSDTI